MSGVFFNIKLLKIRHLNYSAISVLEDKSALTKHAITVKQITKIQRVSNADSKKHAIDDFVVSSIEKEGFFRGKPQNQKKSLVKTKVLKQKNVRNGNDY